MKAASYRPRWELRGISSALLFAACLWIGASAGEASALPGMVGATPNIEIIPPPSSVVVPAGETREDVMIVMNTGDAPLDYSADCPNCEDDSGGKPHVWLALEPSSGTVQANSSQTVIVRYDTTGLPPGQYPAQIEVSSNDTTNGNPCAPVNLTVQGSANCQDTLEM